MKTIYLIKSIAPLIFLPLAPGMVQVELVRQGLLPYSGGTIFSAAVQILFTLGIIAWLVRGAKEKKQEKAFVKMSCISKKICHKGQWMSFEQYLSEHHNITVSHGMTPEEATAWMQESEDWLREEIKTTEVLDHVESELIEQR